MFALHRIRACTVEEIKLVRNVEGGLETRGRVPGEQRRAQLLAALDGLPLTIRIETGQSATEQPTPTGAGLVPPEIAGEALPLARSKREAAALRRLAEWVDARGTADLDPQSWWLLDTMVREHAAELRRHLAEARRLLEPILSGRASNEPVAPPHDGGGSRAGESWTREALNVFSQIERAHLRVTELFANPGSRSSRSDSAIIELLYDIPTAEQELEWLEKGWIQTLLREDAWDIRQSRR